MVRSISLWYIMLKQVLSLQVLKDLFQAPSNKLYNKGVSLLLNTMSKGIHLFIYLPLSLKHFPRRNDGNSIYTYRILMECLRNKDPQYMTTFLIPNRGKYWLRGDCLIHGQSPLSLFLSILDNRFLIYILSFLRLSCRTIVIQNQPQEFF